MPGATTFISKNFGREEGIAFTITKRTSENKKAFKGSRKRTEKRWRGMKIIKNYRRIQISEMLHILLDAYACNMPVGSLLRKSVRHTAQLCFLSYVKET